jgi:hypothetical protein
MSRFAVKYAPYDGDNGLRLEKGILACYYQGTMVGKVDVAETRTLEDLMADYSVASLFPDLLFCYTRPAWYEIAINFSYAIKARQEVHGELNFEGRHYLWWARMNRNPDFAATHLVPPGQRTWLKREEVEHSKGLEFFIPPHIAKHEDPVVTRRVAMALEQFVYAIRNGYLRDAYIYERKPLQRAFDNFFSIDAPMWEANLPRVLPADGNDNFGMLYVPEGS